MPVTTKFSSPIFDKQKTHRALSNAVSKTVREFAAYVPEQQVKSKASGKLYKKRRGAGFTRSHRASARGQRPAPDSGKLLKSTRHKMTGEMRGEVSTVARSKGFDYAAHLEGKMDRPIQDAPQDIKKAQELLDKNGEAVLKKLT